MIHVLKYLEITWFTVRPTVPAPSENSAASTVQNTFEHARNFCKAICLGNKIRIENEKENNMYKDTIVVTCPNSQRAKPVCNILQSTRFFFLATFAKYHKNITKGILQFIHNVRLFSLLSSPLIKSP